MGLSARKAAPLLGMTHPGLLKAAKDGRVTRLADGTFDVEECRKQLAANTNALKQRKKPAPKADPKPKAEPTSHTSVRNEAPAELDPEAESQAGGTLNEAQRRREWVRLQKEELALKRLQGELAPIAELNAWFAGVITKARDIFLRIGPELKDRLGHPDPHERERIINEEVDRGLRELALFTPTAPE